MNTHVLTGTSFMSVTNLKTLVDIFERFLKERYSFNHRTSNLNLKEIIYETMTKMNSNNEYSSLTKTELNKITLSIVKNVIKSKVNLDPYNDNNHTNKKRSDIDRPDFNDKSVQQDLNLKMEILSKSRELPNSKKDQLNITDKLDKAYSEVEFMDTLQQLQETRSDIRETQEKVSITRDTEMRKVFQKNFEADHKDLYQTETRLGINSDINQVIQERNEFTILPDKKPEMIKRYIVIDSRDRDTILYSSPSDYVLMLDDTIRNVCSVELVHAMYNSTPVQSTDFYVNLQIEEFVMDTISTNSEMKKTFTQLPCGPLFEYNSHTSCSLKEFIQPIRKLGKLSFKFKNHNGTLHTIGEHLLKFEIHHYNTTGDMNISKDNIHQNDLQDEIFLARDITDNVNENLELYNDETTLDDDDDDTHVVVSEL